MDYPRKKSFSAELLEKRQKKSPTTIAIAVIAVIIAIAAVSYILYSRYIALPGKAEITSIAVLPFVNMSADPDQEYFCDGIADAILNALTRVGDLRVIARSSSFAFRGDAVDIREVGEKLNANWVLEGSVQKAGNELRITAQLINVADLSHLFSNVYEREMKDIFDTQEEISLAIVEALKVNILKEDKAAIVKRPTENTEAYDLYMMGRHLVRLWRDREALDYFLQAVEKDSSFAAAYAEIALDYATLGRSWGMAPVEAYTEAKKALERAFELDDTLPGAYTAQGEISLYYEWDWRSAEDNFKKAIDIDPSYMEPYTKIDNLLVLQGREREALELQRNALEIDPLSLGIMGDIMPILGYMGDYEEAEQLYQKMVVIDPTWLQSYWHAGFIYAAQGKYDEAIATFTKLAQLNEYSGPIPGIGFVYALMGKRAEAEKILVDYQAEYPEAEYPGAVWFANIIRLGLKDFDPIFEWFENLYNERSPRLAIILLDFKRWDKDIVSHPRWKALMKKMGLPE